MTRSVITGASTGIGRATALRMAREGHEVHASVRSLDSGAELLEASDGLDLSLVVMDVDDGESVTAAFASIERDHGSIDVLVNNAGVAGGASIEETPLTDFIRLMNTNTWGALRCIQAVLPSMRGRGAGAIVNVTSLAGVLAQGGQGAYVASKFALEGLTEVLAIEARPFGIRVSAIEPGVIKTPIFSKGSGGAVVETPYVGTRRMGEVFRSTLGGRPGTPDEVAEVIWTAITSEQPQLRYSVGDDAGRMLAYRASVTDEAWVAHQSEPDDDVFRAWISDVSGVDVRANNAPR